ncbi:hypothetical protein GGH19_000543 [Coemansia sp. RSA 1807]|nr:hypothetical protein GGH19_000543 [Coemansia sp. RSA 1807]
MVQKCGLENSVKHGESIGYNHKNVVYLSWADANLASIVCNGAKNGSGQNGSGQNGEHEPGRCYSTVFAAETIRVSGMMSNGEADKSNVCNDCTREWASAIRARKNRVSPLLYYGHIPDAEQLASWISELCDYKLTPF